MSRSHMKGSVCCTFPLSTLCSILLAQLHTDFCFVLYTKPGYCNYLLMASKPRNNSSEYRGTETERNKMRHETFILEMVKGKLCMRVGRIVLMSKYENHGVCIGFSWLRMKSVVSHCQDYKLLIPLKHGMSRSTFLCKTAQ
jgi:hypothetical protein